MTKKLTDRQYRSIIKRYVNQLNRGIDEILEVDKDEFAASPKTPYWCYYLLCVCCLRSKQLEDVIKSTDSDGMWTKKLVYKQKEIKDVTAKD